MVSLIGSWMQMTGQSWLVLTLTNSPFWLGLVGTLQWTPSLLLSLYAGVIVDRFPKRRILLVTQSLLATLAMVLAVLTLTGYVRYWHVLIIAALVGCVQVFDMPARQSFVVEMTGKEDLLNAIALNSTIFNLARVVGPAVAGLVVNALGTGWAFFLNSLSFLGVIYSLAVMDVPDVARRRLTRKAFREIAEGLRYVKGQPTLSGVLILLGLVSTFALNFSVLVPTLARNVLGGDSGQYGLLMSAMGAGALVGSVALATFGGSGSRMGLIRAGSMVLGLGEIALCFVRGWGVSAVMLAVCGAAMVTFSASTNTTIQVIVPDELRGRVMSLHALVFAGVTPLGSFLTGSLAQELGVSATFGLVGAVAVLSTLVMTLSGRVPDPTPTSAVSPASPSAPEAVVSPGAPSPGRES